MFLYYIYLVKFNDKKEWAVLYITFRVKANGYICEKH